MMDDQQSASIPKDQEARQPMITGGPSGFLNYGYSIRLGPSGQNAVSGEFTISQASAIAIRNIFVEAFMDIGGGGFPSSVPTASLTPKQFDQSFYNPTIHLLLTKDATIPNTVLPQPPDLVDHYWGEIRTYFHLAKGRSMVLNFSRNASGVRYCLLKVVFTIETW